MLKRLLAPAILLLLLPTSSASDLPESPEEIAGARALTDGNVRLTFTVDDKWSPGDVLPLCANQEPVANGTTLLGHIRNDCFQTLPAGASTEDAPILPCPPVHAGAYLFPEPDAYADPDVGCIIVIIGSLLDRAPGFLLLLNIER